MFERHIIQCDRYKPVAGIVHAGCYISKFIEPLQQIAAEKRALLIHVLWVYELSVVHLFNTPLENRFSR
jgi:hypothetical protein